MSCLRGLLMTSWTTATAHHYQTITRILNNNKYSACCNRVVLCYLARGAQELHGSSAGWGSVSHQQPILQMLVVMGRESPPAREWGELLNEYLMKKINTTRASSQAADSSHHQGQPAVGQALGHSSHAQMAHRGGCKGWLSQVCVAHP